MYRADPQLIEACLAGRQDAWDCLVERYGRLVYSIPRRYGMTEADSEDVFQHVFATLFEKLDTLNDVTRLSSWLITTTHRACWRIGKKGESAAAVDQHIADVGAPSDDQAAAWERQDLVRRGLDELGGRCRDLLTALFLGGDRPNYDRIAERLGMTIGSIGPTRARCFEKLRVILEEMGLSDDELAPIVKAGKSPRS